jgi:hypothetical protein
MRAQTLLAVQHFLATPASQHVSRTCGKDACPPQPASRRPHADRPTWSRRRAGTRHLSTRRACAASDREDKDTHMRVQGHALLNPRTRLLMLRRFLHALRIRRSTRSSGLGGACQVPRGRARKMWMPSAAGCRSLPVPAGWHYREPLARTAAYLGVRHCRVLLLWTGVCARCLLPR